MQMSNKLLILTYTTQELNKFMQLINKGMDYIIVSHIVKLLVIINKVQILINIFIDILRYIHIMRMILQFNNKSFSGGRLIIILIAFI